MKLIFQTITIALACGLVALITSTAADAYLMPILATLIILAIIGIIIKQRQAAKKAKQGISQEIFTGSNVEVFVITVTVLLIIFLTGGLGSPLYFLLYFLLFGIVFLFEPTAVFVLTIGMVLVFVPSVQDGDLVSNIIKLGSLAFLSPISYFFGREFIRRERLNSEVSDKTGQILEDVKTLKKDATQDDEDELEDIEKQVEELVKQTRR